MHKNRYFHWGLTVVLSACAILTFYDTVFRDGVLLGVVRMFLAAMTPVIYGAAIAYLLAPMVNSFDKLLRRAFGKRAAWWMVRAGSVVASWAVVAFGLYLLFSFLVPQLHQSVATLIGNMEGYYRKSYAWVRQLADDNPGIAAVVSGAFDEYWDEMRRWLTGTVLPQARQTITVLTSGVMSVMTFLKNFFIGIIVSIYLLALKERMAHGARKLLYSFVSEEHYRRTLRELKTVDRIFSGFVRGKLLDSLIIGVLCFAGTTLLRFPYAPLVSVIVGVTNVLPYFGPFMGAIGGALLILLADPVKCLYFLVFVLVLQQLDGNVIGPRILGGSTQLPSFWVVVAILLGGGFSGVVGMFLSVPVFACVYSAFRWYVNDRLKKKGAGEEFDGVEKAVSEETRVP